MRRVLLAAIVLGALLPAAAGAGGGGKAKFAGVDVSSYPSVRATYVTPTPQRKAPTLTENGRPVTGFDAVNLGQAKSIVLAVDRSRSMHSGALRDATLAASRFVSLKLAGDRMAAVSFATRAVRLTNFSASRLDVDAALGSLELDRKEGTALYDAIVLSAEALETESLGGRVLLLLTDGQETTSNATLEEAIDAARKAKVVVYSVGIESTSFNPAPLKQLASQTGGRYTAASSSKSLSAIYASIARELQRTWLLSYVTSARPGEPIRLAAGPARAKTVVPGNRTDDTAAGSKVPTPLFSIGPLLMALLVGGCMFGAAVFLMRAPIGTGLRRRIAPHLGERAQKRSRGPVQERFATASLVMQSTEQVLGHLKVWHALHRLLERADVPLKTVELGYASLGAGLLSGIVFAGFGVSPFLILLAMVAGGALPIGFVYMKAKRRLAAIDAQLPDVLITLAASLKAGHSFRQAIQAVVDEGMPPASKEFKRVLTETRLGRPMDDALTEMAERLGSKNLSFVVTAVTIQRQVGGSLAGIFDMVADTVRQRQQFQRKIRSLTAMGRMSAYVLLGLPIFLAGALTVLNPEYMDPLYHSRTGHMLIAVGTVMMVFGTLVLKKIVSFRG
jgi:tight adherence protein B